LSTSTFTALRSHYYDQLSCGNCLSTPVSAILNAQQQLLNDAFSIDPAAGFAEPIRPVLDGSLLTSSLTTTFPSTLKPILLTTVKDDALTGTYYIFGNPVPAQGFIAALTNTLGAERAAIVANTTFYPYSDSDTDVRDLFAVIGTDEVWKCPVWTFARAWAARGGTAYVGEFTLGATYPINQNFAGCTSGGICHQDDIFILFGTTPNPSAAQTSLTAEVQARWSAFMRGNTPNSSGRTTWNPVSSSGSVTALNLGGTSAIAEGPCTPLFWGSSPRFDYQIFNQ
jgi:carboxylesterase type B